MIDREKHQGYLSDETENPLWVKLYEDSDIDSDSNIETRKHLYVCPYSGKLSQSSFLPFRDVPGGILADEMGLGKSLEVLTCVLANINPNAKASVLSTRARKARQDLEERSQPQRCNCLSTTPSSKTKGVDGIKCGLCNVQHHKGCPDHVARSGITQVAHVYLHRFRPYKIYGSIWVKFLICFIFNFRRFCSQGNQPCVQCV